VCLEWGVSKIKCCVVNVYSSCSLGAKRIMWRDFIISNTLIGGDIWCVLGDFNAVLVAHERRGNVSDQGRSSENEIAEFRNFVNQMRIFDLLLLGRRFT